MGVLFCHGLESGPEGRKTELLRTLGVPLHVPDFRGQRLAERVDALLRQLRRDDELPLLVGSSYGGLTALCAAIMLAETGRTVPALVLCAPAIAHFEPPADGMDLHAPCPTVIIHGVRDAVVPIAVSRAFAARHPRVRLLEVDDDHALANSGDVILSVVRELSATLK